MRRLVKSLLILLSLIILAALITIWMLPSVVQALPGQVRVRLPEDLLRAVTTPLATALPAPNIPPAELQLTAEFVVLATPILPTVAEAPTSVATATFMPALAVERDEPSSPEATATLAPTFTPTIELIASARFLAGMEVTPQKLNNCGPANLSINLNYYGLETTQFDVAAVVKPHYDDRNVSPQELVDYTNDNTSLQASLYSGGDIVLLKELIANGFPVVIEKGYEPDDWQGWMGHYLTIVGYDDDTASFTAMDTYLGPWDSSGRNYSYAQIEEKWEHFNNTFFVIYESDRESELLETLDPQLELPLLMWRRTVEQAQRSIHNNPQNAFAWFNLGSGYSHMGDLSGDERFYTAAVSAFDQARQIGLPTRMLWYQFEPYEAYLAKGRYEDVITLTAAILDDHGGRDIEETYFYRGKALQAQGDVEAATAAYRRALSIKPNYPRASEALSLIQQPQ